MIGEMMSSQLLTSNIIKHAARNHTSQEIISRTVEGPIHRYSYGEFEKRCRLVANVLLDLGVARGDRIGTLAWNTHRHLELYYGISGMGAVCHTINPRLFHDQLEYVINHANDRFLFIDLTFVPLLEALQGKLTTVEAYIILTDRAHMPETALKNVHSYEDLMNNVSETYEWPQFDENMACMLCYTSGTTGNPKGSLYSHRSTMLHALCVMASTAEVRLTLRSTVLCIVPMFHVGAWGYPFKAPIAGAKIVLPADRYDGEGLYELMEQEEVTLTAGVPTIVTVLLEEIRKQTRAPKGLRYVLCGGSAPGVALMKAFEEDFGVTFVQGWGMTETSPVAAVNSRFAEQSELPEQEKYLAKRKAGRANFGIEAKIVDDQGRRLPEDGKSSGELLVRGPYIIGAYFDDQSATEAAFSHGWFRTGDVCVIEEDGTIMITDRSKDLIKSGGEWISSIDLENQAMLHPAVAECAAIACHHPKWEERPLLVVVAKRGETITKHDLLAFMQDKIAKWWIPDDIVFVDNLPHGSTGKVSKKDLRLQFQNYKLPQ